MAVVTDNVVVHTADGSFAGREEFLADLDGRIDALQMSTGVYLDTRADIYVVPDRPSYQDLARGKDAIVEFSDAFYTPSERRIYIRSADQVWQNYAGVIVHEYAHWYLDEIFWGAPLWFHEGLATRAGNQLGLDRYLYYVRERFWGNKMDLFKLAYSYPTRRSDWEMYYLTSYFAVEHLRKEDPEAWLDFWEIAAGNYRAGRKTRFTAAFGQAYDSSLYAFNQEFAQASKRQAWIYLLTGFSSLVVLFLPLLLIYAIIRQRNKMQALPDLELPEELAPQTVEEAGTESDPDKE